MITSAVEAFTTQNADLARRTMESEDIVDQLRYRLGHELLQLREDGKIPLEALAPLLNILNRLERVADQARNISQDVLYLCTGEYVKHLGSDVYRVLFVDDENSSISQIAECIGYSLNQPLFVFTSAGMERKSLDPATMAFLQKKGLDVARNNAKALKQVPYLDQYQIVIALTRGAQAAFPPPPTKVVCLDWSMARPTLDGTDPESPEAELEHAFQFLQDHIKDLVEAVLVDVRP
jgi:protein-tyrosine-phosphatase